MENVHSIMNLYLRYRLWIAELNFDINILRIFKDHLKDLSDKEKDPEIISGITHFENQFINIRKDIDELRHEMHLFKMKLGAYSRQGEMLDHKTYKADHHLELKRKYVSFRKKFDMLKTDFCNFRANV